MVRRCSPSLRRIAPAALPTSSLAAMTLKVMSRFGASSAQRSGVMPTVSRTVRSNWMAIAFNCRPNRKNWAITATGEKPTPFVTLSYVSPDGEEGYPGRLQTSITYSISGSMELSATFSAETDKPTIVNLTNHGFFNLAGVEAGGGILDHHLTIAADTYLPVSRAGIPLGAQGRVDGTPFDFRIRHRVGVRLHDVNEQLQIRQGYDHNFCLRGGVTPVPRLAARLEDPRSGRVLELLTNQPGVQFYSGNFLDGTVTGKYGRVHRQYDALCLEPQAYPDTPNRPDYPSARLDPGQTYRHTSLYRFSAN